MNSAKVLKEDSWWKPCLPKGVDSFANLEKYIEAKYNDRSKCVDFLNPFYDVIVDKLIELAKTELEKG